MMVSVCLIVWNEEKILARAVASTEGLADEVVVVDTGSTDGTVALARDLGARVFTGADRMHKAESRNRAQDEARGDWVVILDADETIADPAGLRAFLEGTDARAVYIKLAFVNAKGRPTLSYQQMRCWRRGAFRYKYRAHEVPLPADGSWANVARTDFVWEHRPPKARGWKMQYTLDRLLLDVEENPGASRPLYYLGRQYMYLKDWAEAARRLEEYLGSPGIDAADAWHNLAECRGRLGDEKGQVEALHRACAVLPGRRDWWCELAQVHYRRAQYEVAAGLLKCALEIPMPENSYTSHYWYGSGIHDLLARTLWKLKRYPEGRTHALRAVELEPENRRLWDNLAWFEGKLGQPPDAFMGVAPVTTRGLKVLMLAYEDYSGKAHACMKAFNAHSDDGRARLVTWQESYLRYPRDVFQPSAETLRVLIEWADVVHVFDQYPWHVARWGKPLVITYSGSHYRQYRNWLNRMDERMGAVQLCSTLDLAEGGPRWCPRPIGELEPGDTPADRFLVSHAPTRRNENKGTDEVIRQLSGLDGVELDVIEMTANAECLRRKARSHLYVDQFLMGYGTNALEAWAMGIPVIAGVGDPALRARMEAEIGELPFVETRIEDLRATVERLRDDADFYKEAREKGMRYVREFHAPARVAGLLRAAYDEARERGVPAETAIAYHDLLLEAAKMDAFYRKHGPLVHTKERRHKVLAGMVEGDRVLDVGCGTGDLLLRLQGNGHGRLVGTDISGVALALARQRGVTADLVQTGDIPEGPFSTIVISQVLEHVTHDGAMIREAAAQLEPGGLLVATVPVEGKGSGRHHKRHYTPEAFAGLLAQVGEVTAHEWKDPYRLLMTARKRWDS